ncbi:DUF4388 domain-containing protein [Desulfobotulus sp. H1]|uniref:DUF4388 domain-containing protein n=1 Tax=Desulfobotulus pelophilus TaxID=2823377 RepID=A0ABT3NCK1_9BACT|nr:DUF4388 domain-containing protein [Desulfobotulus pelophilus]MCW7755145.1 DUF4388 domain-containing protein [Desulfobotulus pelophilus]
MPKSDVLSGKLSFISLADLLQFLGTAVASGEVRIFAENGAEGVINMKNGDVFDARQGGLSGEKAFHELFTWQDGDFLFLPGTGPASREIHRNLTGLLLDALRRVDESREEQSFHHSSSGKEPFLKGPSIEYSDIVDEEFHRDGSVVVRQGRFGSWLWVILEGKVRTHREIGGRSIPLFCLGKGAFIGSAATFSLMNRPRNASVHAVGEVLLGVLDAQRLAREYTTFSPFFQQLFLDVDKELTQLGETLARLRSSLSLSSEIPKSWTVLQASGTLSSGSFFCVKGGRAILAYKGKDVTWELASFAEDSILAHPMAGNPLAIDGLVFMGDSHTSIVPVSDADAGMLWDRLSPTFRKMLGFSLKSVQTTLELIGESIDVRGKSHDTDPESI